MLLTIVLDLRIHIAVVIQSGNIRGVNIAISSPRDNIIFPCLDVWRYASDMETYAIVTGEDTVSLDHVWISNDLMPASGVLHIPMDPAGLAIRVS